MGDWPLMRDSAILTLMIFFFPTVPGFVCQMHSSTEQEGCHSSLAAYFVTSDTHITIDDNHKQYS